MMPKYSSFGQYLCISARSTFSWRQVAAKAKAQSFLLNSAATLSSGDNPAPPLGNWNMVFQLYLSFMCLCPAVHLSLTTCQITQLISVLPRTVYLKDTQHSFLGIRISAHHPRHIVQLNQLRTPVSTKIQCSQAFHRNKEPFPLMKIIEFPILSHVAILKTLCITEDNCYSKLFDLH